MRWESREGGRNWQKDPNTPQFLSRIWVSPADGGVYATATPIAYDTSGLFLTTSASYNSAAQPAGVLWKRGPASGTPVGARVLNGDLLVSCDWPTGVPNNDPRRQRAIGPGATFPVGHTTLHCTATDAFKHTGSADIEINVDDTTPPVLTVPPQVLASAPHLGTVTVPFTVTSRDAVHGPLTPSPPRTPP